MFEEYKLDALKDVSADLGYLDYQAYNDACVDRPWEVWERLQALR